MSDPAVAAAEPPRSRPACRVAHAWLSEYSYRRLELQAQQRGLCVDRLSGRLLERLALDPEFVAFVAQILEG